MADRTDAQTRIDRARERTLDAEIVNRDPIVIQVDSGHSDRVHTIVPEALHCSCEDATYNVPLCWHIVGLALDEATYQNGLVVYAVHEALERASGDKSELIEMNEDYIEALQARNDRLREELVFVHETLAEVGDDGDTIEDDDTDEDDDVLPTFEALVDEIDPVVEHD